METVGSRVRQRWNLLVGCLLHAHSELESSHGSRTRPGSGKKRTTYIRGVIVYGSWGHSRRRLGGGRPGALYQPSPGVGRSTRHAYDTDLKSSWAANEGAQLATNQGKRCAVWRPAQLHASSSEGAARTGDEVQHVVSAGHWTAWEWIVQRIPDAGASSNAQLHPAPGHERFSYACSLFYGDAERFLTVVGREHKVQTPSIREYIRLKRIHRA
jgi:hypothetical protein